MGDILVVVVTSDERVRERKGHRRPIQNQGTRVGIISELKCVDYALIGPNIDNNRNSTTIKVINELQPNIFVTPDLQKFIEQKNEITSRNTKIVKDTPHRIDSTTEIINRILELYKN